MPDANLVLLALAVAAAMVVGLSKGGVPVVGMLGVPILALAISPVQAAAVLLPIYVITDMFGLWVYRRNFDRRNLAILLPAAVFGVAVGWATATLVSERAVTLMVGVIGMAYCLDHWRGKGGKALPRQADVPRGLVWGALAGFTSFVSHAGAPPFQWYVLPQWLDKMTYVGTTTIFFAIVNIVKLFPYWALGQFSPANVKFALLLVLPAVAATLLGVRIVKLVADDLFFRLVMVALFLISLKLIADGFLS
ncbi:MAG: sulfite exporter TauE/SafE family protein [Pseudomonadota bacterium]|nr:sulfite exporter TauE/SafE family protein [Pseudomonadota bacterium]